MAKKIFKKGGKIENFSPEKIKKSLNQALEGVNLSTEERSEIIEKIFTEVISFAKERKELATVEIEAKILLELDKICPQAAHNWREYRQKKQK